MFSNLKMAALAAAVTLTSFGYSAPSIAQDVEFMIGPDGVRVRSRDYCERNRWDRRRCGDYWNRGRDRDRDRDRWDRRRSCDRDDAVDKARNMGIRRARVVDSGRRTIEVAGFSRRGPVIYTFGRQPGCPLLDRDFR